MGTSSQFAPNEIRDIIIAWLVLSFAVGAPSFASILSGKNVVASVEYILALMIATVTGFIFHELGHKFVAIRFGYVAHFKLWIMGLLLAVFTAVASATSGFPFIFGAPGAVYIMPAATGYFGAGYYSSTYRASDTSGGNLKISVAGPGLNLIFGGIFLAVALLPVGSFLGLVGVFGLYINVGLGAFNMLPIPPMDGYKIFKASIPVGLAVAIPLWIGALFLLGLI